MKPLRRFFRRVTSWTRTARDEERLRSEIAEHIALQTADNLRAGMDPAEARRRARLQFGGVEAMKEEYRDQRSLPFLETLAQDSRHAVRRLRKAPAFTVTTVLTLALGIGATTSVFTLVYAVLMKSLAVANPGELYRLGRTVHCCVWGGYTQSKEFSLVSDDMYLYFRDHTKGFAELAAFQAGGSWLFGVRRAGTTETAQSTEAKYVSGNYFDMFGIKGIAGRMISPADDAPAAPPVAVMSGRLWREKYGSSPNVIGGVFLFDGKPFTVVGIVPPSFYGDTLTETPPSFFLPLSAEPLVRGDTSLLRRPATHWLDLIGRAQPGVSAASLEAQMRVELKQWLHAHWNDMDANERARFPQQTLYLSPGGAGITSMRQAYEHWLHILMWVAGFVLAIVCANVANLMLVRGMERRQQTSLSVALGARASRLVRQALTECLILALAGGVAGIGIACAGTRMILHFVFTSNPGAALPISASPSLPVLLFALAVSLVTGLAFGLGPAWMAARVDPVEALRGANRSTIRRGSLPRKTLVVLQAALSLVLLSASGLLTAALRNLENQDFGFEQARRTVVTIDPQLAGYHTDQLDALYRRIHDSMMAIPGVQAVALCGYAPQSGDSWNDSIYVDGHPKPGPNDSSDSGYDRVTGGFLDVIGNPILRGRGITDQDVNDSPHVAVINQAFARKFFKNEDPLGKHFGRSAMGNTRQVEIVGIAKDARFLNYDLDKPVGPFLFLPEAQYDVYSNPDLTTGDLTAHFAGNIVIETRPGATVSDAAVRHAMASVDAGMPVIHILSLSDMVSGQFSQQRLIARLTSFFGLLSLVLAALGIYGVTAYNAERRSGEIGLRVALGANRGQVMALVLRGALGLVLFGLLIGLPLAYESGQFLGDQLFGLDPHNAVVTAISALALAAAALVASIIPALRACRISPLAALRAE